LRGYGGVRLRGPGGVGLAGRRYGICAGQRCCGCGGGRFLLYNFPPARIFLGDLGADVLGLLAATLSLIGSQRGLFPLWVAWLAFWPFIVDATWTLPRRLVRGERVWKPHRSHHYQCLVLMDWSHRRAVLRSYLLMGACAATAVAVPDMGARDQWFLLSAWVVIYLVIGIRIRSAERSADTPASMKPWVDRLRSRTAAFVHDLAMVPVA